MVLLSAASSSVRSVATGSTLSVLSNSFVRTCIVSNPRRLRVYTTQPTPIMTTEDGIIDKSTNTTGSADLTASERSDLLARIDTLEKRLREQTAQLTSLSTANSLSATTTTLPAILTKPKKPPKPFNASSYPTRRIALKLSYIGAPYNGFEHSNNTTSAPPKPTIEEVLWKALRKARLISPQISEGSDQSYEVVWDERARAARYGVGIEGMGRGKRGTEMLELVWDGCGYSKCGRTDKGVSAFGQVIGITVRSRRPRNVNIRSSEENKTLTADGVSEHDAVGVASDTSVKHASSSAPEVAPDDSPVDSQWDPIRDELPYIAILNGLLPPSIRILAWCPFPTPDWDARWICKERRYKYFFTNPAFCPTPGVLGLRNTNGTDTKIREGWLDIEAMKVAAKKLEGSHDYRNFCKIDASKQMSSCQRIITFATIEEFNGGASTFVRDSRMNQTHTGVGGMANGLVNSVLGGVSNDGPKVYAFAVHGSAFLWHQVRCMVAVLFLIGQGLEKPEVIDDLLDIQKTPGRPTYEMADDAPLVLWDCIFPADETTDESGMNWIYAGDESIVSTIPSKGDGKFGVGGLMDNLWVQWREAKMKETLAAGLLGLALSQGDGSPLDRGGHRDAVALKARSQKLFDGSDVPRLVGNYMPIMKKSKQESLEVQNAKYMAGKQARRDANKSPGENKDTERTSSPSAAV